MPQGSQLVKEQAKNDRRGEEQKDAHIIRGKKPAAKAVSGVIAVKAGAGDTGQNDDAGVAQTGGSHRPVGNDPAPLPVHGVKKCGGIGEIKYLERF